MATMHANNFVSRAASLTRGPVRYIERHLDEIHEGGISVLLRKSRSLITKLGWLLILLPMPAAVLLMRALRPFIVIRIGELISSRIGHYAANTEVYLCERDADTPSYRTISIFYDSPSTCNYQLKKMWDRTLPVSRLVRPLDRVNRLLPGYERHVVEYRNATRDINNLLAHSRQHVSFTAEEVAQGEEGLWSLGVPEGAPFVCFHARDSAYLESHIPAGNWRYHDHRDSTIRNYLPAAEELARRGYYVMRMGAVVGEALPATNSGKIIDYAVTGRTDFMDIYLSARCRFFLGTGAGICTVPSWLFRRPVAYVNFIPMEYLFTWFAHDVSIPKKLWLRKEHRFMRFREVISSGAGRFQTDDEYEQGGIEPVENTAEEISSLVLEMDDRLNGTWQTTEEGEDLQRRFWALFRGSNLHGRIVSRIGTEFLRQNQDLLD